MREAQQRYRDRQRAERPVRSRAAERYRKRRARFVRNTHELNPNSVRYRNSLLILQALDGLPPDDYFHQAAVRLLEVVPRFSTLAQVRKWLQTTAKRFRLDDVINTPTTGLPTPVRPGNLRPVRVDVAEAVDHFGDWSAVWVQEDRDWGRSPGFASWYPSYWYDPVQRKSWIRWSDSGRKPNTDKEVKP